MQVYFISALYIYNISCPYTIPIHTYIQYASVKLQLFSTHYANQVHFNPTHIANTAWRSETVRSTLAEQPLAFMLWLATIIIIID